ncbi:MAG TPA: hypothetical protein VND93_12330 [Myxococcales bacterium]|nr:hypothetical protein [Myxococcales bacterium]
MGQSKLSRYLGMFLFTSAILCMIGFWWSRTSGSDSFLLWANGLKWTVIALAVMGGYMAAVGLYHTILAALGLDGEPGILSRGARSGPFSGPPVDVHHAVPVEGAGVIPEPPGAPPPPDQRH